ncbi:YciI family protein [Methylovulum miyakonense]|uniref:YciI family protein n=1 Tax=Methylovulum miyakonense TaxID=645578 RepID=UPI0003663C7E|nr:YciI family protein [Methylovulum miyakonense]
MKYLCLICAETVMEQMDNDVAEHHFKEYAEFTKNLKEGGHYLGCNRLLPPSAAVTVRVRGGKVSATDGPFAETKEQFGGYYLIEARDLNEAIQIASRIPGAKHGCVEVRPVAEDEQTLQALGFAEA